MFYVDCIINTNLWFAIVVDGKQSAISGNIIHLTIGHHSVSVLLLDTI